MSRRLCCRCCPTATIEKNFKNCQIESDRVPEMDNLTNQQHPHHALMLYRRYLDQNCNMQRLPHMYDSNGMNPHIPVSGNPANLLNPSLSLSGVPLPSRHVLGSMPNSLQPIMSGGVNMPHGAGLGAMDLSPGSGQRSIPSSLNQHAIPGTNGNAGTIAAMAAAANMNPAAAAAMLFSPFLFQNPPSALPSNAQSHQSMPGAPGNASPEDRLKLAALQNHLFFLHQHQQQQQQRQQQVSLLASVAAAAASHPEKMSPTEDTESGQNSSEKLKLDSNRNQSTSPRNPKRTLEDGEISGSDAAAESQSIDNKVSKLQLPTSPSCQNISGLSSGSNKNDFKGFNDTVKRSESNSDETVCPICGDSVSKLDLSGHLMEEFCKFQQLVLKKNSPNEGRGCLNENMDRNQAFFRVRSNRQDRISSLPGKLRMLKSSISSFAALELKTSPRLSSGKTPPLDWSQIGVSSSPDLNGSMSSPISPSAVIRSSLDHFDKVISPKNTQEFSPTGKRLLLIESLLNNDSSVNNHVNKILECQSEPPNKQETTTESSQGNCSGLNGDVTEGNFRRLTSSASEIEVR